MTRAFRKLAGAAAFSALAGGLAISGGSVLTASAQPVAPTFSTTRLAGTEYQSEPRVAVGPDGTEWEITNLHASPGTAVVYRSTDSGLTWTRTAGDPAGQSVPSIDVDITVAHTGRVVAAELDFGSAGPCNSGAINFQVSYSDDQGKTWTCSTGMLPLDNDRQYVAAGPDDPTTHQPRVYLLQHNLLSGSASHHMWVLTSKDGGATFGAPVDTTVPGEQTYADLQCADSGGPSNLFVNQKTGRVFAVYGTRSSQVPLISGCTAQPVAVNVVPATRTWVTYSDTPDVEGSWKQTLAVDDSAIPLIEGQQLSPLALDNQGNAYLVYAEGLPGGDYTGVIKYVWAPADLSKWSAPITVTPVRGAGHVLPHVVAGDPGKVDFAYMTGVQQGSSDPLWYSTVAQTLDGMDPQPTFSEVRIGQFPSFGGTDGALMGACGSGPTAGVQNGFFCSRSSDIYGVALDAQCNLLVSWPAKDTIIGGPNDGKAIPGAQPNTYISKQTGATPVCAVSAASTAPAPVASSATLPNTAGGLAPAFLVAPSAALLGLLFATRRRPA